jgi:predicted polyphosphate/ATP-dependent NAD kinase
VPILGIPAGVKMFSAVFALNPHAAAEILRQSDARQERDGEILDVDEDAYRRGELRTILYGYARVPYLPGQTQGMKQEYDSQDEDRAKEEISAFISEIMQSNALYILGPGTTTAHIADRIGVRKTLLGFDAVKDGELIGKDLDEQTILDLIRNEHEVWVIISPIGAQGALLGRGTQQLSPQVLKKIGLSHIIVVATPYKLSQITSLFVDTADPDLDMQFGEFISVISGYRIGQRKRLHHPGTEK